jgi:hypothetical protein
MGWGAENPQGLGPCRLVRSQVQILPHAFIFVYELQSIFRQPFFKKVGEVRSQVQILPHALLIFLKLNLY